MTGAWLREEQADLAADKILDAASRAFVELGVSRTGMGDIAQYAGCSRATLYRHRAPTDNPHTPVPPPLTLTPEDPEPPRQGPHDSPGVLHAQGIGRQTDGREGAPGARRREPRRKSKLRRSQ